MTVRMRHTRAHTANRRSHHAIKKSNLVTCEKCGKKRENHRACGNCGVYNTRAVLHTEKTLEKKVKKTKAKTETK